MHLRTTGTGWHLDSARKDLVVQVAPNKPLGRSSTLQTNRRLARWEQLIHRQVKGANNLQLWFGNEFDSILRRFIGIVRVG